MSPSRQSWPGLRLGIAVVAAVASVALIAPGRAGAAVTWSPVRHLPVGNISIGYRTVGAGRPLVMIVGFGATMAEWDPALLARLGAHRRVIVFDNRGVATSTDSPGNRLTITEMAQDTFRFIRKLGYRRADILGWSMGSFIAQELVLHHPGVVRRLILSGADPGSPHAVQPSARVNAILNDPNTTPRQLVRVLFPKNQQQAGFAYLHRVGGQPGLVSDSFTVSPAIFAQQVRAEGPLWYCRGCGTYARLPRVRAPTLVADGSDDILEPPANSRIIASRIPHAHLLIMSDSGHAFMFQYNRLFSQLADAFLSA
jgi:pimeloyl-ACP methyl ester carboxylesterase